MANLFHNIKIFTELGTELPIKRNYAVQISLVFNSEMISEERQGQWGFVANNDQTDKLLVPTQKPLFTIYRVDEQGDKSARIRYAQNILVSSISQAAMQIFLTDGTLLQLTDPFLDISDAVSSLRFNVTEREAHTGLGTIYKYEIGYIEFINDGTNSNFAQSILNKISQVEEAGSFSLFPYFFFGGNLQLEKVSVNLVSTRSLFFIYEDGGSTSQPWSPSYEIECYTSNDSSTRFISDNGSDAIQWSHIKNLGLGDIKTIEDRTTPLYCSIGFLHDTEGCYSENIEFYLKNKTDETDRYFLGYIKIFCEVVGEDERYRTFFTNFGVPDPITYSHLFAEQDPSEEGLDFQLINKKSKELFLSYDKIFPYVGTYKALINAVTFLGYDDIIFKEWYRIPDEEAESKKVAFQSIDLKNKETLKTTLAYYGISYDEFVSYKKLNQISMIYHINEVAQEYDTQTYLYDNSTGVFDIPIVQRTYDYDNEDLLAKLISVRDWLQRYIIGVNCRIIDLTGEGVYFARFQNHAYSTYYNLLDYQTSNSVSPFYVESGVGNILNNSSTMLKCSLSEFENLKIHNYDLVKFKHYSKALLHLEDGSIKTDRSSIDSWTPDYTLIENDIPFTTSFEAPVTYDEVSFEAMTDVNRGTFHEYNQDGIKDKELLVEDQQIKLIGNQEIEYEFRRTDLPYLSIERGNIRKPWTPWKLNIEWTISQTWSEDQSLYLYKLVHIPRENSINYKNFLSQVPFILKPYAEDAYLKYTEANKYQVPLFMFHGYAWTNQETGEVYPIGDGTFILEILDGQIIFDPIQQELSDCKIQSFLRFSATEAEEDMANEMTSLGQYIVPEFRYSTPRKRIWELHRENIRSFSYDEFGIDEFVIPETGVDTFFDEIQSIRQDNNIIYWSNSSDQNIRDFIKECIIDYAFQGTFSASQLEAIDEIREQIQLDQSLSTFDWIFRNDSQGGIATYAEYLKLLLDKNEQKTNWNNFRNYIREILKVNTQFDLKVTREGNYNLQAKAYNSNNEIYVGQSKNTTKVTGATPHLQIYTNDEYSTNDSNFYSVSKIKGTLIDDSELVDYVEPTFPTAYRILDFNFNNDLTGTFSNISYVYDIPRQGDYFILNNFSERVTHVEFDTISVLDSSIDIVYYEDNEDGYEARNDSGAVNEDGTPNEYTYIDIEQEDIPEEASMAIRLTMLDENPNKQELYLLGSLVMIYLYDKSKMRIYKSCGPYYVIDYHKQDPSTDDQISDQSYLLLGYDYQHIQINQDNILLDEDAAMINIGLNANIQAFVANVNEWEVLGIYNNYNDKTCEIVVQTADKISDIYRAGEKVKISIYMPADVDKIEDNDADDPFNKISYTCDANELIAETTYTVKSCSSFEGLINNMSSWFQSIVVDGLVNDKLFDRFTFKNIDENPDVIYNCKIARAFQEEVQVDIDVTKDSSETVSSRNSLLTSFKYGKSNWMANSYLDNTWSGYLLDYNPSDTFRDWTQKEDFTLEQIYRYEDVPITIGQNQMAIFGMRQNASSRYNEIYREWEFRNKTIENIRNVVYRSTSLTPGYSFDSTEVISILGKSYDKYGNCYEFGSDGALFVRDSSYFD